MSTINGSRLKILAMLFLFVPQESWDLQLRMFGYITCGFPRIFGYVLQVIKYSISVPLDRGGFGGWNLMLTHLCGLRHLQPSSQGAKTLGTRMSYLSLRMPSALTRWSRARSSPGSKKLGEIELLSLTSCALCRHNRF